MLARAVRSYLTLRRTAGFQLTDAGLHLRSFAAYSDACGRRCLDARTAIEWARRGGSVVQRARRLGHVIRFARYLHAEDPRHEIPPASSVGNTSHEGRHTFSQMSRSVNSSSWPRSRGTGPCAGRLTAPCSRYFRALGFVSPKPSGCGTTTLLRMDC